LFVFRGFGAVNNGNCGGFDLASTLASYVASALQPRRAISAAVTRHTLHRLALTPSTLLGQRAIVSKTLDEVDQFASRCEILCRHKSNNLRIPRIYDR
jgi:hypothetical protein